MMTTQDSHSQGEHIELYKILKLGLNWINIEQLRDVKRHYIFCLEPYNLIHFFAFLNGFKFINIVLVNTKLWNFVKLNVFFFLDM